MVWSPSVCLSVVGRNFSPRWFACFPFADIPEWMTRDGLDCNGGSTLKSLLWWEAAKNAAKVNLRWPGAFHTAGRFFHRSFSPFFLFKSETTSDFLRRDLGLFSFFFLSFSSLCFLSGFLSVFLRLLSCDHLSRSSSPYFFLSAFRFRPWNRFSENQTYKVNIFFKRQLYPFVCNDCNTHELIRIDGFR